MTTKRDRRTKIVEILADDPASTVAQIRDALAAAGIEVGWETVRQDLHALGMRRVWAGREPLVKDRSADS